MGLTCFGWTRGDYRIGEDVGPKPLCWVGAASIGRLSVLRVWQDVDQEWSKLFEVFLKSNSDLSKGRFLECL